MGLRKNLSKKQKGYVDNVVKGISKDRSAIMAGATTDAVKYFDVSPLVKAELARVRKEAIENTGVTKEEVVNMFMEAANFARILGDPMGLIAAARELGKMLGHYAPEVKKTLHGVDAATLRKALKDMNDDELYKLAHARTIEGEVVRGLRGDEAPKQLLQDARQLQDVCGENGEINRPERQGSSAPTEEDATRGVEEVGREELSEEESS